MTANQSWIYQGRQEHGWFGDGTSPEDDEPSSQANGLFQPANAGQRADYVAGSSIMHLPRRTIAIAGTLQSRTLPERT